jgi:DNA-binding response OmpR family regulator
VARVLLVDDEPDILDMLELAFQEAGHETCTATNGQLGIEQLEAGPVDVVVLDMMMPVVDGWAVLETKQIRGDLTPVVVVSARSEPDIARRALELGAVEYVLKPFDLDRLLTLVATVASEDEAARQARRRAALDEQQG